MTSHDFASHMVCFNKSNLSLALKMASFRENFELTSVLQCVYLLVRISMNGFLQSYLIAN